MRVLLFLLLCATLAGWAEGPGVTMPLARDAAASTAFRQAALAAGRCLAADLAVKRQEGTLLTGVSDTAVPAGRYRLHVPLALAPLGDLRTGAIAITLTSGDAQRRYGMLHFANADEFTDLTLDIATHEPVVIACSVSWALTGPVADKNRKHLPPSADAPDDDALEDVEALEQADDGTIRIGDLPKIPCRLAAAGVHIERLSPVAVTMVATDKIVYKPGEKGTVTVSLVNHADAPVAVSLATVLQPGLAEPRPLATTPLTLAPGVPVTWTGAFATTGLRWGAEIGAVATVAGFPPARHRAVFAVTGNPWETAIASNIRWFEDNRIPANATRYAELLHANYSTLTESYSWAADDFGDFTPDTEEFFGGQCGYTGSVRGTQQTIAALHKRGIAATVYAFLYGGDGPPSIEMMRRHPDWFSSTSGPTDYVENWYLQATHQIRSYLNPIYTNLNRRNSDGALTVHARELIDSHRIFGWDGVRYDSYYSDPWVKASTRRVRELVGKAVPEYRWGYNSIVPYDVRADALDVMVGGGNLVMEEGIRWITNGGGTFSDYANTVLTYRDLIWSHDGHLGVCYDEPRFDAKRDGNALDAIYLSSILLSSGVHPYYGNLEGEIGKHARFALRYAEILYNNNMRPLSEPENVIRFGAPVKLMNWQRLARTIDLGGDRHRLVIHLLQAPVIDACMRNPGMQTPAALRGLPITLALPAGTAVDGAWLLSPIPDAGHVALPVTAGGNAATVLVPEVRVWGIVVVEYRAQTGLATRTTMTPAETAFMAAQIKRFTPEPAPSSVKTVITDDAAAAAAKVVSPVEWPFPRQQPLSVLTVQGYWFREYAVERALARLGGANIERSWVQVPTHLRCYPADYAGLMRHHLVIVTNVNAEAFTPVQRKMLADYVYHGGAVLFLGGWYAFGPGYHTSAFAAMAPVTFSSAPNPPPNADSSGVWSAATPGGWVLAPGKDVIGAGFAGLPWAQAPRVYWYHPLTPKPGAKVLLTAGGKPLLIAGVYGKGRVAVFAGSVMGDPAKSQLPFWQWDGWPAVLAQTARWLTAGTATPASALSADARAALREQLLGVGVKSAAVVTALLIRIARTCGDRDTARLLLDGVAGIEADAPAELADAVSDAVSPYVDATFAALGQALLESGTKGKIALGLRVLGRTKAADAAAVLARAVQHGEVDIAEAAPEQMDDPMAMRFAIRLGALEGLGYLGDPAQLPLLRAITAPLARAISKRDDVDVYLVSEEDELYLQAQLAALRCGEANAAATTIDAWLATQYVIARQMRLLDYAPDEFEVGYKIQQAQMRLQHDRIVARQRQALTQLRAVPPAVLPVLARRIAREPDPLILPVAFAVFGGAPLPADVRAALVASPLPAVADLGR